MTTPPLILEPVTYTAGGGRKKMYFCLSHAGLEIHYCLAFGTISLGQLGGCIHVTPELAREIYHAVVLAAPEGLYLEPVEKAITPMLKDEEETEEKVA